MPYIYPLDHNSVSLYLRKRKSENMFNKYKSPETFISKTLNNDSMLLIMNKNILYLTHTVDKCLTILRKMQIDTDLQTQVDDFHEDSAHEEDKEPD